MNTQNQQNQITLKEFVNDVIDENGITDLDGNDYVFTDDEAKTKKEFVDSLISYLSDGNKEKFALELEKIFYDEKTSEVDVFGAFGAISPSSIKEGGEDKRANFDKEANVDKDGNSQRIINRIILQSNIDLLFIYSAVLDDLSNADPDSLTASSELFHEKLNEMGISTEEESEEESEEELDEDDAENAEGKTGGGTVQIGGAHTAGSAPQIDEKINLDAVFISGGTYSKVQTLQFLKQIFKHSDDGEFSSLAFDSGGRSERITEIEAFRKYMEIISRSRFVKEADSDKGKAYDRKNPYGLVWSFGAQRILDIINLLNIMAIIYCGDPQEAVALIRQRVNPARTASPPVGLAGAIATIGRQKNLTKNAKFEEYDSILDAIQPMINKLVSAKTQVTSVKVYGQPQDTRDIPSQTLASTLIKLQLKRAGATVGLSVMSDKETWVNQCKSTETATVFGLKGGNIRERAIAYINKELLSAGVDATLVGFVSPLGLDEEELDDEESVDDEEPELVISESEESANELKDAEKKMMAMRLIMVGAQPKRQVRDDVNIIKKAVSGKKTAERRDKLKMYNYLYNQLTTPDGFYVAASRKMGGKDTLGKAWNRFLRNVEGAVTAQSWQKTFRDNLLYAMVKILENYNQELAHKTKRPTTLGEPLMKIRTMLESSEPFAAAAVGNLSLLTQMMNNANDDDLNEDKQALPKIRANLLTNYLFYDALMDGIYIDKGWFQATGFQYWTPDLLGMWADGIWHETRAEKEGLLRRAMKAISVNINDRTLMAMRQQLTEMPFGEEYVEANHILNRLSGDGSAPASSAAAVSASVSAAGAGAAGVSVEMRLKAIKEQIAKQEGLQKASNDKLRIQMSDHVTVETQALASHIKDVEEALLEQGAAVEVDKTEITSQLAELRTELSTMVTDAGQQTAADAVEKLQEMEDRITQLCTQLAEEKANWGRMNEQVIQRQDQQGIDIIQQTDDKLAAAAGQTDEKLAEKSATITAQTEEKLAALNLATEEKFSEEAQLRHRNMADTYSEIESAKNELTSQQAADKAELQGEAGELRSELARQDGVLGDIREEVAQLQGADDRREGRIMTAATNISNQNTAQMELLRAELNAVRESISGTRRNAEIVMDGGTISDESKLCIIDVNYFRTYTTIFDILK